MSSRQTELWFDGPNYTADCVIVDSAQQKLLLIKRSDNGQWALPGGFVDSGEASSDAAVREAYEETTVNVTDGQLVYRGIVDDPRNSEHAWIETDAYLFLAPSNTAAMASDDACDAQWFSLGDLPPLYASHSAIVERAVDSIASQRLVAQIPDSYQIHSVDGGHMNYSRSIITTPDNAFFVKRYDDDTDDNLHVAALQKEAAMMAHLRSAEYPYLPAHSHYDNQQLCMEALAPQKGWRWRAPADKLDNYITDCLEAFAELERAPIPPDTNTVPSALGTYAEEGWRLLDTDRQQTFATFTDTVSSQLRPSSHITAKQLHTDLPTLRKLALGIPLPDSYAFCHHDARQANIAWHQDHGVRLVDWSWADIGRPGSDATMLLIDLHKHGHDIASYRQFINPEHCVILLGFWLEHALRPAGKRDPSVRLQQYVSALAAYEVLADFGSGV